MSEEWYEYGYEHNDGHVTNMGLRYTTAELERTGGPRHDEFLTHIGDEEVTVVTRVVIAGPWEVL